MKKGQVQGTEAYILAKMKAIMKLIIPFITLVLSLSIYSSEDKRTGFPLVSTSLFLQEKPIETLNVTQCHDRKKSEILDEYHYDQSAEVVWAALRSMKPSEIWNNNRARLKTFSNHQEEASFDEKSRFSIDMSILSVVRTPLKTMVAIEVDNIDDEAMSFQLNYLQGTPSCGYQEVQVIPVDESSSKIVHVTYFRSYMRSVHMAYPMYHEMMLDMFYDNLEEELEQN